MAKSSENADIINVIKQTTRKVEEEHNLKTTQARENKILKDISPALSKLDPEYLAQYSDVISHQLAKSLREQGTYMGRARGELRVSEANRARIADNLLKDHLAASEKFVYDKIRAGIYKQELTNTQIANRLNEFAKATGAREVYSTSNIPSDNELVQIRKANQKLFDNLVLGNGPERAVQNVEIPEPKKETVVPKKPEIVSPPKLSSVSNPIRKTVRSSSEAQSPAVKPKPDNELAANEPAKPKISDAKVDATIKALRGDFAGITGFIAGEFLKIAKANNGVIDIENPTFAKAADSLINADPRIINSEENVKKRGGHSAVLSFTGTKQGIEEKIDKLIAKGADPSKFTSLREDLSNLETELRTQTSSSQGIKELVGKKMTSELIATQTVLFIHDEKGEIQSMPMVQKKDIIAKIAKNVHLDNAAVSTMLSGEPDVQNLIKGTTNRLISETLGKKDKNFYVLDESKFTPENLEKLSKSVENAVSQAPLVSGIIKSIEQESGLEINDSRKAKLLKNLSPALSQLDPEYLEQYKDVISKDLAKQIQAQGSRWGRMNGELRTSTKSQQMIANNLLEKHLASSEEFVTKKISGTFYKKQLTNAQMADRLNEFAKASGSEHEFKPSKIPSDKELAQMRKANPKLFDEVVLGDKAKPKIPDDVRQKLSGNMKVENSKKAAVHPTARGKVNQSADRGM